ncbi:MAG: ParB/RepB/Spo0J family partition protein [Planctomycetota bacterium]
MAERKLGRGLDSLLGVPRAKGGEEVTPIPVTELRRSPFQPRQEFDEGKLQELAASIKESGVLQPILVRPSGTGYEIVAGERRFRAAEKAGLKEIPALIRPYSDEDVLVLSLVENVQRADLNPIDKAQAYQRLVKHLGATQADIAQKLGLNSATVSNMLRLLELPSEVKDLVRNGALTMGHARALLALPDEVEQLKMAERVIREGLSVRAVEEFARRDEGARAATPKRRKNPRKTPQVAALEADLRAHLGTKVSIQDRRGKGRITIEYYSPDDFERVVQLIRGDGEQGYSLP